MRQIPVPGGPIAVVDEGAGTPILFVHGFPLTHAMWQSQIQALAGGHRVLVPDLRGFGESRWTPERSDGALTMEAFADDLHALLESLSVKGPVIFCGLSMGGYVGWQFFRKYRAQVKALIQCDTRAAADKPEAAAGRFKLAEQILAAGPEAARDAMLPRLLSPKTQKDRPDLVAVVRDMIMKNTPIGLAAGLRGLAERRTAQNCSPRSMFPRFSSVARTTKSPRRPRCAVFPGRSPAPNSSKFPTRGTWPHWRTPKPSTPP